MATQLPKILPSNVRLPASRRQRVGSQNELTSDHNFEPHFSLMSNVDYDLLPGQIGFWIRRAQLTVMKSLEKHTRDLNLRPVESAAILLIGRNKDISQIVLTSALSTDQSTMVAVCTRLEKRGLIERRRLPEDRRYQVLNLTPEGQKAATVVRKRLTAHNERMLRRMNGAQRKMLMSLIKIFVDH